MKLSPSTIAGIILCLAWFSGQHCHAAPPSEQRIIAYVAEWGNWSARDIPPDLLTHVNYAFALIKDGRCSFDDPVAATQRTAPDEPSDSATFQGHFRQLDSLKHKYPHLRTLISIGGWGGSSPFSDVALTPQSRDLFASSCAQFASKYHFDGVDIDWEYPGGGGLDPAKGRPEDTQNFTLLLASLRKQLDEQGTIDGKHYLLTIAAPASPEMYHRIDLKNVAAILDWINLMTYDFAGGWSPVTNFNAPLYSDKDHANEPRFSADSAVQDYLAAGVPTEKLVLGVPFYGHAWAGAKNANNGLFQEHDSKPAQPAGGGEWTYRTIASKPAGAFGKRFWNDEAKVPWLYEPSTGLMVSYDDPQSIRLKAEYVHQKKLGGVMIWELSQDDAQSSLLKAIHAGLDMP